MTTLRRRPLLLLAALVVASQAGAHGVPTLVTTEGSALALLSDPEPGVLAKAAGRLFTEDPGFGVNLAATGPPTGTPIGLETLGGLLFWDGAALAETDAVLTLLAPEFDSLLNPNNSPVASYTVDQESAPQTGLLWSRYRGDSFWDAHGLYLLETTGGALPAAGLYGAPVRLVDQTSVLAPSDPFVLPVLYGDLTSGQLAAGLAEFAAAIAAPLPGDYDRSGVVDLADYDAWLAGVPEADGNGDGRVDAADYTLWRDALSAAPQAAAIPEPAAAALALLAFIVSRFTTRTLR